MFEITLPAQLASLKSYYEVHCVASCCGLNAFEVNSDHAAAWLGDIDQPALTTACAALQQLEEVCSAVRAKRGRIGSARDDFNTSWRKPTECLEFLESIQRETVRAVLSAATGVVFQHSWMQANDQAARGIATAIATTGDFAQLPVLGDALEEAGCRVEELLAHCRAGGAHGRRCWVVDLLLAGDLLEPTPLRTTMPRRNRGTPFGDLIAVSARGTLMGNRGCLHDHSGRIDRDFVGQRWLLCRLSFKGRQRTIMEPGRYTELFFLDEATGLAAGHRPCAECQRERFVAFRDACGQTGADAVDRLLDSERHPLGRRRSGTEAPLEELPSGVMVLLEGDSRPYLVRPGRLYLWSPEGYAPWVAQPIGARVRALTPPTTVRAIRAGYEVGLHPTAAG